MQKKTRTRIWSILLSMTMLLSLLPVTALAEGNTIYAGPNASGEGDGTRQIPMQTCRLRSLPLVRGIPSC